mgnify:CR=1 FL=1
MMKDKLELFWALVIQLFCVTFQIALVYIACNESHWLPITFFLLLALGIFVCIQKPLYEHPCIQTFIAKIFNRNV